MFEPLPVSRRPVRRLLTAMGSLVTAVALVAVPASAATASTTSDGEIGTGSTDGHRVVGDGEIRLGLRVTS